MDNFPDFKMPELNTSMLKSFESYPVTVAKANLASEFCKKLLKSINEFDSQLDKTKQVGIRLVSFGQTVTFAVGAIGYNNPSLIYFYGTLENGSKVQLVQHVSQISFLMMAVDKINPEEPKRKIGFIEDQ